MAELKPCPICNSIPKLNITRSRVGKSMRAAYGYTCVNPDCNWSYAYIGCPNQDRAIDEWNEKVEWQKQLEAWSECLNPCECGGKAELVHEHYGRSDFWLVRCQECQALLTPKESMNAIIEAWNRGCE